MQSEPRPSKVDLVLFPVQKLGSGNEIILVSPVLFQFLELISGNSLLQPPSCFQGGIARGGGGAQEVYPTGPACVEGDPTTPGAIMTASTPGCGPHLHGIGIEQF